MPPHRVPSRDLADHRLPRHSTNGSKRSRASSTHSPAARLSIIEEDGDIPPMPPRAHHRPFHRRWNIGDPPRFNAEKSPPKYSVWDTAGPKGEKLADVRNNKHIARRGGWKRMCLITLLTIGMIVALVVGLVFGLRKKNSSSHETSEWPQSPENNTSTDNNNNTTTFPAGSYTFTTYLDTVQTDCSSQVDDWKCYPYHTSAGNSTQATANFTWIITDSADGFSVSSTKNPWSIVFDKTFLMMLDPGTDDERYQFNTTVDQVTVPSLGVNCFFNSTTLEGNLYTKKAQNYPRSSAAPASSTLASSDDFQPWPYAVDIRQTIGGGQSTPECFRMQGNQKGDRIMDGIVPRPASSICSCEYRNFDS